MNYYREKEGRTAAKIQRAVLGILCVLALVFAACDTGTGSSDSSESSGGTPSRAVEGVTLTQDSKIISDTTLVLIEQDGEQSITAELNPPNPSNKKVSWSSSDPTVAKVDTTVTGLSNTVTPLKDGDATITVTADGGRTASFLVKVKLVKSFTVVDYKEYYDPNDDFVLVDPLTKVPTAMKVLYTDGTYSAGNIPVKKEWIYFPKDWNILSSPGTFDFAASEPHELIVRYGRVEEKFKVTIRSMRWVSIVGTLKRTVYNFGETFDPDGLTLTASYDIGPDVVGIPLTEDILATARTNNQAVGQGSLALWNTTLSPSRALGPFWYKGKQTSDRAINQGALNGTAAITGLTVTNYVVKIGDKYMTAGDANKNTQANWHIDFKSAFKLAEGKTATISVTTANNSDPGVIQGNFTISGSSIPIPAGTHIKLVAYSGGVTLNQGGRGGGQGTSTPNPAVFRLTGDGSLEMEDFTLITSEDSGDGTNSALVELTGPGSKFTLGDGSLLQVAAEGVLDGPMQAIAGAINIQAGEAVIQPGAKILIDPTVGSTSLSYMATAGVFVGPDGTLTMNGGEIRGTPRTSAATFPAGTDRVGVGDVVVAGALVLNGDAWIQRLALAAGDSPVAKPMVTINTGWNPNSTIILNLTGNSPSIPTVQSFFTGRKLLTGAGVPTGIRKFEFIQELGGGSLSNGAGWFRNGNLTAASGAPAAGIGFNPTPIQRTAPGGTPGNGDYSFTSEGVLTVQG